MPKALGGIRVLDLSRILAGPWATQNLADLGAEVIKVERPSVGDDTRSWGPPFIKDPQGNETNDSSYYLSANRGKKSVTIDLSTKDGQALVRTIADTADILVENYKVGDLARYGLSYEELSRRNPRLIYCSVTGFGQDGPYAKLPGYDYLFQGLGGLMSITGLPDGQPGGGPMRTGIAICDALTGVYATSAILAALNQRHATGRGQFIDIALMDCAVALTSYVSMNYFVGGRLPARLGNGHPNIVPYEVFQCRDKRMIVAVANENQYRKFCVAIGRPDLADSEEFANSNNRLLNRDRLIPVISDELRKRNADEWAVLFQERGIPCGPINTIAEVFEDPHVVYRQLKVDIPHPTARTIPSLKSPLRLSDSPVDYDVPPPMLGQHTQQVLEELCRCTPEQISNLREKGVV